MALKSVSREPTIPRVGSAQTYSSVLDLAIRDRFSLEML